MKSELAEIAVNEMWKKGLCPTVADIVRLNALGLAAERGDNGEGFDALPRMAFLGDLILTEPTLAKRIWLDTVLAATKDNYETRMFVTAYALNTPDAKLPDAQDVKGALAAARQFKDAELLCFSETEIVAAINIALVGSSPSAQECGEATDTEIAAAKRAAEVPQPARSAARAVLASAIRNGISAEAALRETRDAVERMVALSLLSKYGEEYAKSEKLQNVGVFNLTADRIAERLTAEKTARDAKEANNGEAAD